MEPSLFFWGFAAVLKNCSLKLQPAQNWWSLMQSYFHVGFLIIQERDSAPSQDIRKPCVWLLQGDCEDHATLLCSLMLGFGLDAYVCVGTKAKGTPHCWVLTRGTDGTITFWESLTAHRFIFQHANSTHRKAPIPGDRTRSPLAWPLRRCVLRDNTLLRISALKMELNRFDVTEILRFRSSGRSQKASRKSFELCCAVCICQRKKLWFPTKAFPGSEPENIWLHSSGLSISWILSIIVLPTTHWSYNGDRRDFRDRNRVFVCSVQVLDHVPFFCLF